MDLERRGKSAVSEGIPMSTVLLRGATASEAVGVVGVEQADEPSGVPGACVAVKTRRVPLDRKASNRRAPTLMSLAFKIGCTIHLYSAR